MDKIIDPLEQLRSTNGVIGVSNAFDLKNSNRYSFC